MPPNRVLCIDWFSSLKFEVSWKFYGTFNLNEPLKVIFVDISADSTKLAHLTYAQ